MYRLFDQKFLSLLLLTQFLTESEKQLNARVIIFLHDILSDKDVYVFDQKLA